MTPVALVTVNPAMVLAVTNVKYAPLLVDSAGSVHEGLPLVERLIQTLPESAEVKTIVAPTKALSCTAQCYRFIGGKTIELGKRIVTFILHCHNLSFLFLLRINYVDVIPVSLPCLFGFWVMNCPPR